MPSGFDCSLLLRRGDLHAESEGVDREGGRDVVTGGLCVKGVVREVARSRGCDRRIPGVTGEEQGGREDEGEAGCDPTELVALQVRAMMNRSILHGGGRAVGKGVHITHNITTNYVLLHSGGSRKRCTHNTQSCNQLCTLYII